MQTGTAGIQNVSDIDSIGSKSLKNVSGDQEESFLMEFMAQHMPPNIEKEPRNENINADSFFAKNWNPVISRNSKLLKCIDSGNGKLDKVQIDESKSNEHLKQNADPSMKFTAHRSEYGVEEIDRLNAKSGEPYRILPGTTAQKANPDIEGQPRNVELAGSKMELLKEGITRLQEKLSVNSENEPHARFINSPSEKAPAVVTSLDAWQKYMNIKSGGQKPQILEGNIKVSEVINVEMNDGEETKLTSNNHTAEKNLESVFQTKEPSHFQRQFQPVVMRQLVEKAIFGIKNGQSLIKISLKPERLGHLRMQISTDKNQVAVRIITEFPMVKEIIESSLNQLRADLQSQGLEIDKFNVYVNDGSTQNDRNPSHIPLENDEDGTGKDKVKEVLTKEAEGPVLNMVKGWDSNLIDFFA